MGLIDGTAKMAVVRFKTGAVHVETYPGEKEIVREFINTLDTPDRDYEKHMEWLKELREQIIPEAEKRWKDFMDQECEEE